MKTLSHYFASITDTNVFKIGGLVAIAAIIPVTLFAVGQSQDIRQRAQSVPATPPSSSATFSFSPASVSVGMNNTFSTDSVLSSPVSYVTGIDVTYTFNKDLVSVASFVPSGAFDSVLYNTIDNATGTIRFAGVDTTNNAKMGNIMLGKITFTSKTLAGTGSITTQNVQITAASFAGNLPNTTIPASYTVLVPTATPTLTPTPSPLIPTSAPTNTPAPTATPVPPTVTPTLAPVPSDINKDGSVNILDYNIWRDEFKKIVSTKLSDINKDGNVDLLDFNIWRSAFIAQNTLQ